MYIAQVGVEEGKYTERKEKSGRRGRQETRYERSNAGTNLRSSRFCTFEEGGEDFGERGDTGDILSNRLN